MSDTQAMGRSGATLRVLGWDGSSLGDAGLAGANPLGFAAGDANLYRYVGNSPTNFTDPDGLQAHPLSRPTDPNAVDSGRFNALVLPIASPNLPPNTPIGTVPFNDYFENAVIRMLGMSKYRRAAGPPFVSPARAACPNGRATVEPDAVNPVIEGSTKKGVRVYPDSLFVDAKRGNIYLRRSLYYYESVGYADVLSRCPLAKAGGIPMMVYVTTADIRISQTVVDDFTNNKVLVGQSFMAYDPNTKQFYLTPPVFLNDGLQKGPRINGPQIPLPQPQFPLDWNLIKPF